MKFPAISPSWPKRNVADMPGLFFGRLFLGLALTMGVAVPGQAAQSPERVTPEGLAQLHEYSRCVVFNRPTQVRQVLALEPDTPDFSRALGAITSRLNNCTHGRLAGGQLLFAGTLAEHLIERDSGLDLASATAHDPARPALQAHNEGELMAMCLLRRQPGKVSELFGTRPGSPAEASAVTAIQPHLAECVRAGQQARLNRPALRAMLALASFRLIAHNSAPATAARN